MVGRRPSSSKVSLDNRIHSSFETPSHSPPPYESNDVAPLLIAETTTTTREIVTTTQTTTHLFSLPSWRKRSFQALSSQSQITTETDKQANGNIPETAKFGLMVEKALPPTPSEEIEPNATEAIISRYRRSQEDQHDTSDSRPELRTAINSSASVPSTIALAHAALGLGLPHVMPRASMASSSDINTIAFVPPPDLRLTTPGIRRAKSSQKLRDTGSSSNDQSTLLGPSLLDHRRTRGLSFGTTSFLNFGSTDAKGKGKEVEVTPRSQGSPKTVSRRTSFWSRKKTSSVGPSSISTPATTPIRPPLPSLPSVPPVSPFYMDTAATPTLSQTPRLGAKPQHSRGLSRSVSDRALHRSPPALKVTPDVPADTRISRRPATADPSTRSGAVSLLISSPSVITPHPYPPDSSLARPPDVGSNAPTPRPRAHTNPPILQRLSLNLFSSTSHNTSSAPSYDSSPAVSTSNSPRPSLNNKQAAIPRPLINEESPEIYLERLLSAASKVEVAGILATSSDNFYAQALKSYLAVFDFIDDPLDVALRKLLMDVGLPRETQQIDRVIEAFAARYLQCNPRLFTSEDHPYILAFSLIMLHTDAFNKSNKRKMSKADYIKNTRLPGVASEVLDCFYDNIVFAPFIFIEDPLDVNGQRGVLSEQSSSRVLSSYSLNSIPNSANGTPGRGNKVDPYYLITNKLLDPLRVDITAHLPLENPYSYEGTSGPWDESELQHVFAKASEIEVGTSNSTRTSIFGLNTTSGPPSPLAKLGGAPNQDYLSSGSDPWTLRVTKVGLLNRKDDVLEGGRKASNRKWKSWSVILTGSQLLLFRDPSWAVTLLSQSNASDGQVILPQTGNFYPDELLSVKDAIAVFDKSYTKYDNTFRFVMLDGRQLLLQASGNQELNEWISRINYASAFKSCGVRMRPAGLSGRDVELTGVAAATSHLHDMQHQRQANPSNIRSWDNNTPQELMGMLSGEHSHSKTPPRRRVTIFGSREDMDLDVPVAPEVDGADQFKATFDQVKAELASGRWRSSTDSLAPESTFESAGEQSNSRLPSRSQIIQTKIRDLEAKIAGSQSQLDSHMRLIRNIATLTPFQRATRDRLVTTVQAISKRVAHTRLDITRLTCYRDVLRNDLISEEQHWHQAKKIALRVATETLQSRSRENGIPKMTLSLHNDGSTSPLPRAALPTDRLDAPPPERRESSTCGSFHSAIDFGPDWPTSEDQYSSTFLNTSQLFDSPKISSSFPRLDASPVSPQAPSPRSVPSSSRPSLSEGTSPRNSEEFKHEKYHTASETLEEQAEEWNKTRCAQRVSLVRVPSTIRMSTRFERQGLPELPADDEIN